MAEKAKRGRPASGCAVSPADRNRKYRAKAALLAAIDRARRAGVDVDACVSLDRLVQVVRRHADPGDGNYGAGIAVTENQLLLGRINELQKPGGALCTG